MSQLSLSHVQFFRINVVFKDLFLFGCTGSPLLCGAFSCCVGLFVAVCRFLLVVASLVVKHRL